MPSKKCVLIPLCLLLILMGCHKAHEPIKPQLNTAVQDRYLKELPSPFAPLTQGELSEPWGREYQIGLRFAKELDLYLALTSFKRAYFLAPEGVEERKLQLQYYMLLCYYFGQKYGDVIYTFEHSQLRDTSGNFAASHDLLVILYDSYTQVGDFTKADQMMNHMDALYPKTSEELKLSSALKAADFTALAAYQDPEITRLLEQYQLNKKSVHQAQSLNAVLPGAGYLYLGQKQSAMTAFLLNGLFIAAAVHFFQKGHTAAGAITTGFEIGWYVGGIVGAKEEATFYNERVYEAYASPLMHQKKLFPTFMITYAF